MFEYRIIDDTQGIETEINLLAAENWRFVGVIPEGTYRSGRILLERRKPAPPIGAQMGRMDCSKPNLSTL